MAVSEERIAMSRALRSGITIQIGFQGRAKRTSQPTAYNRTFDILVTMKNDGTVLTITEL